MNTHDYFRAEMARQQMRVLMALFGALSMCIRNACALDTPTMDWPTYKITFAKSYATMKAETSAIESYNNNVAFIVAHNLEAEQGMHSYR
jgi:hypothetical protein